MLKSRRHLIVFASCTASLFLFSPQLTAADISQVMLQNENNLWSLGAAIRTHTSPYKGEQEHTDFMPMISYTGERFYIDGNALGFHLQQSDQWQADLYTAYRFGGYTEEDSSFLEGMERNDSVDIGLALTQHTPYGSFTLDPSIDIGGRHHGWDTELSWYSTYQQGPWRWRPWIGLDYRNQQLTDYYFGVESQEATDSRNAYRAGSSINYHLGIDLEYRLDRQNLISLNLRQTRLDDEIADSSIVDERNILSVALAYRHEFKDFVDTKYKPSYASADSRWDQFRRGQWFWRVAGGVATEEAFNKIIRGQVDKEERHTGIASVFAGKKVADNFLSLPFEVYVKAGYVRHFERGIQSDFNEYVLAVKGYFNRFPWSDKVETRWGIAEGISYAEQVPSLERENVESKNYSASHMLNYIDWSLDVNLGDLFAKPQLKRCYAGFSIHHRSGIFGSVDFFGNVDGGSNYNTLYIECLNNIH
jgi:MipA family protein